MVEKKVLLLQGYGLTETSPLISMNLPLKRKKYSVGRPINNIKIRIKDGEIQVKGPNVMKGYYKQPEKTKNVFDNKWFKTGDIGEIKNNFLYFKGRKKEIIVTKAGLNVYPEDIEKELNKYVKESCILEKDNNIHAVLIMEKGNPKKIIEETNKKLEQHQKIISWSIYKGMFPKTPTGKIKRYEIFKHLKQKLPIQKNQLHELLASNLKTKIKDNIALTSLGMDSLKRMEIISSIEEHYGVELNEKDLGEKTTTKDLEKLLKKRKKFSHYTFKLPKLHFLGEIISSIFVHIFCRIHCKKTSFQGLIAANHVSSFDVPVIMSCIKTKHATVALPYILGINTKSIKHKIRGFFLRHLLNTYPFGSEVSLENSLRFTAHLLDKGYSIMIFPEGERTRDGKIHAFKEGIGLLALNMDSEVLPVKTEGLFKIFPYNKTLPNFGKVKVKTGKPLKIKKTSYFKATKLIEKKVKSL